MGRSGQGWEVAQNCAAEGDAKDTTEGRHGGNGGIWHNSARNSFNKGADRPKGRGDVRE